MFFCPGLEPLCRLAAAGTCSTSSSNIPSLALGSLSVLPGWNAPGAQATMNQEPASPLVLGLMSSGLTVLSVDVLHAAARGTERYAVREINLHRDRSCCSAPGCALLRAGLLASTSPEADRAGNARVLRCIEQHVISQLQPKS